MKRVTLFQSAGGETHTTVEASIDARGALVVEGQDIGKAPREAFGDGDYEYWLTVAARDKDRVLLLLLKERFGVATASSEFKEWLDEHGIAYDFKTF